jgi:acetoacetyl-CoA synthetase
MSAAEAPIWAPGDERRAAANVTRFLIWLERENGLTFDSYEALWRWSVDDLEGFWDAVWRFYDVAGAAPGASILGDASMPGA